MYWGSVRFYKHIIYAGMGLLSLLCLLGLVVVIRFFLPSAYAQEQSEAGQSSSSSLTDEGELGLATVDVVAPPAQDDSPGDLDCGVFYQSLYPDLHCDIPTAVSTEDKKVVYLTFDDGPSALTPQVLEILDQYQIKATFFVVTGNNDHLDLLPQIAAAGHAIGIHSASHDYKKIYSSVDAFLEDFQEAYQTVVDYTGEAPTVFRFPGGSINVYNLGCYEDIISEMLRRGFRFYDWNVSTQDAQKGVTAASIYESAMDGIYRYEPTRAVILAHDSAYKESTVQALPKLIEALQGMGYEFRSLDNSVVPVAFSYK